MQSSGTFLLVPEILIPPPRWGCFFLFPVKLLCCKLVSLLGDSFQKCNTRYLQTGVPVKDLLKLRGLTSFWPRSKSYFPAVVKEPITRRARSNPHFPLAWLGPGSFIRIATSPPLELLSRHLICIFWFALHLFFRTPPNEFDYFLCFSICLVSSGLYAFPKPNNAYWNFRIPS